jgi:hypothetical protein
MLNICSPSTFTILQDLQITTEFSESRHSSSSSSSHSGYFSASMLAPLLAGDYLTTNSYLPAELLLTLASSVIYG